MHVSFPDEYVTCEKWRGKHMDGSFLKIKLLLLKHCHPLQATRAGWTSMNVPATLASMVVLALRASAPIPATAPALTRANDARPKTSVSNRQ